MAVTDYKGARKESTGYTNLLTLKWGNTSVDWDDRVTKWPTLKRGISTSERAFIGGGDSIVFADDDDQTLWGSFYGANGTQPLWSVIELESSLAGPDGTFAFPVGTDTAKFGLFRFGDAKFGDDLFSGMLTKGRTLEIVTTQNNIQLNMFDDLELIDKAKFIWDYSNLATTSGDNVFGTVHRIVNATTFIMEESDDRGMRDSLNNISLSAREKTYGKEWEQLSNFGAVGTDVIFPGDVLKFSNINISNDDAGSVLLENEAFTVSTGSFRIQSGVGTFGTIVLNRAVFNVTVGDYVYRRKPLVFEGNPAAIIRDMVTGVNTTVNIPSGSVSGTHFHAATAACDPMNFRKLITDETNGAVLREIQAISEPLEAEFFFDRSGKWIWIPFRPRLRDNIDIQSDFYDALDAGTDNIIGEIRHVQTVNDLYARTQLDFCFDPLQTDPRLQYCAHREATNVEVGSNYHGWDGFKYIPSQWIQNADDARVIGRRLLYNHATAHVEFEFNTSLYGLEEELYRLLVITHRSGSMTDKAFSLTKVEMNLQDNSIGITVRDINRGYLESGYGYYLSGSNALGNVVSGTSSWGFTWPDSEGGAKHGTLDGRVAVSSDAATYTLTDSADNNPSVGLGGVSCFICMGSEIYKSTDSGSVGNPAGTYHFDRHQETTGSQKDGTAGDGFTIWPVNNTTDYDIVPLGGKIINGASSYERMDGTAFEINTGTYGTLFRLF